MCRKFIIELQAAFFAPANTAGVEKTSLATKSIFVDTSKSWNEAALSPTETRYEFPLKPTLSALFVVSN